MADRDERKQYILTHTQRLKTAWRDRDAQIKKERSIVALTQPKKVVGFVNIVLNDPKVLYDTCVALLSGYEPRLRMPLSTQDAEEQDKMSKAERFLVGVWRELDRQQLALGRQRVLRELAYHVCSGWYNAFPYIDDDQKFRLEMYDPLTVYPEWGSRGLVRLARAYWTTPEAARLMADENGWDVQVPGDETKVEVVSFWEKRDDKVYNSVLIDGRIGKEYTEEDWSEIPILCGVVSGSPPGYVINDNVEIRYGENVITSNIATYEQLNRLTSLMMQIVQDTSYPNVIDYTASGEPGVRQEDMGSGKIHHRRLGETLELFKHASTPIEVNTLLSNLGASAQRGGLPYVIYGGLPFELSGFALSQLLASIRHKLAPYLNAYSYLIGQISTEYLRQFKLHGKKVELTVETRERRGKGESYIEEFAPKDLPKVRYVEANVPLAIPSDKAQQILMARQAMNPPALLSRPTLWDEYLDIQDQELEYKRIIDDAILNLPAMQQITMVERLKDKADALRQKGNDAGAAALEAYADTLLQQLAAPAGGGGNGSGIPNNGAGLPTEMTGMVSPDMKRAMLGIPPTGEGGQVKRPEGM